MSKDSLGDRMKSIESISKTQLPRRCYTIMRLDGRSFHSFTKGCERPFDRNIMNAMQYTAKSLCEEISGCKFGYTQSDEITLILTDFDTLNTQAWFDGQVQKMVSGAAAIATAEFNKFWMKLKIIGSYKTEPDIFNVEEFFKKHKTAKFDCRVYSTSDPWEAFNSVLWRQQDATKNSIQMIARSLFSHKELQNKGFSELNEMLHTEGKNFNDYPTDCKRGAFIVKGESGWTVDNDGPILSQDPDYFFKRVPLIPQPSFKWREDNAIS